MKAAATATEKLRLRYRLRSMVGSLTCVDTREKAAPKTMKPAASSSVRGLDQPQVGAWLTITRKQPMATTNSRAPQTSNDRLGPRREAGTTCAPMMTNVMPMATLIRKAERQPKLSDSRPPTTGPNFRPSATAVPMMPSTWPRWFQGKTETARTPPLAEMQAAPMPSMTRATNIDSNVGISVNRPEPPPNRIMPARNTFLRPKRSPRCPAGSSMPMSGMAYDSSIQYSSYRLTWNWLTNTGLRMSVMPVSSVFI